MSKKWVTSIVLAAMVVMGSVVAASAAEAQPSCNPSPTLPWRSGMTIYGEAISFSCTGMLEARIKWDRLGPDAVLAENSDAAPGPVNVSRYCDWGTGNRHIYIEARAGGQNNNSAWRPYQCTTT